MTVEDDTNVVARNGHWSLFSTLQQCCPGMIRSDDPFFGRHGLTELEFNKVLESNGFLKVRDRSGASPLLVQGRYASGRSTGEFHGTTTFIMHIHIHCSGLVCRSRRH